MAEAEFPLSKPEEKPKKGLFQHPATQQPAISGELAAEVNSLSRRMRMLEERYTNLRKKTQVSDQNMLNIQRELRAAIKTMSVDMLEIKREMHDLREKMKLIVRELRETAKQEEVLVLKKYIDLWEPLKFATLNDVKKMIEEKVEQIE